MRLTSVNYSTPYLGNFFCEIDNYNLAFVAISKNAITYLQSIAIYAKTGYIMHSEDRTHDWFGGCPQSGRCPRRRRAAERGPGPCPGG